MKIKEVEKNLRENPKKWLVTGAAGFIGSNLVQHLLKLDQKVVGFDNLSTGLKRNFDQVERMVGSKFSNLNFVEGDITDLKQIEKVMKGVDYVLHQAAMGSVPRSIKEPLAFHEHNVTGTLNCLHAAHIAQVKKFVYASSSSVYGDSPNLPKVESDLGRPLSPYAATKLTNEIYAGVYSQTYNLPVIGLRYFNVFGPMQRPDGDYAAVIPKWIGLMLEGKPIEIYGDGETSRDFCYIENVVQINLLAAATDDRGSTDQVYNVAVNARTTLNELFDGIRNTLIACRTDLEIGAPVYRDFRAGDIRHSQADISKAVKLLGYQPTHTINEGLEEAIEWYVQDWQRRNN